VNDDGIEFIERELIAAGNRDVVERINLNVDSPPTGVKTLFLRFSFQRLGDDCTPLFQPSTLQIGCSCLAGNGEVVTALSCQQACGEKGIRNGLLGARARRFQKCSVWAVVCEFIAGLVQVADEFFDARSGLCQEVLTDAR